VRVGTRAALHRAIPYPVDHEPASFQYIVVLEPEDAIAAFPKVGVSFRVFLRVFVCWSVNFDNKFCFGTIEIDYKEIDYMLSAKLESVEFARAE